jgi:hypothetical protein
MADTVDRFSAKTMVELKAKARKVMGWADSRTWTPLERAIFKRAFDVKVDFRLNLIVAQRRTTERSQSNG